VLLRFQAPEPEPSVLAPTPGDDGGGAQEGVGTTVVTIIGAVIAAVTVLGAVAVVLQGKSSVEKAEKARDAAAAGDNR
jgi:hypothetical protein